MRVEWRGEHGEFGGTVGVFFSEHHNSFDRQLTTVAAFQAAVVRAVNKARKGQMQFKVPDAGAYEKDGSIAVAVDGSMTIRDQYHRIREVTETWLKCRNLMLERDTKSPNDFVVWNGPGWPAHEFMGKDKDGRKRWTMLEDATRFKDRTKAEKCFPFGDSTVMTYAEAEKMLETGVEPAMPQEA